MTELEREFKLFSIAEAKEQTEKMDQNKQKVE